ncbi:hypothetical protein CEXT_542811 [Caerostris extrusa]|uniref:Uncharacterized protein n=1 Tax=Caerostris extrusa TaxID=172846 RepID=A0AAV4Q8H7_CAEEX|nr:hypothetical protein CEXT_542811 [Caerostris extrusa]
MITMPECTNDRNCFCRFVCIIHQFVIGRAGFRPLIKCSPVRPVVISDRDTIILPPTSLRGFGGFEWRDIFASNIHPCDETLNVVEMLLMVNCYEEKLLSHYTLFCYVYPQRWDV